MPSRCRAPRAYVEGNAFHVGTSIHVAIKCRINKDDMEDFDASENVLDLSHHHHTHNLAANATATKVNRQLLPLLHLLKSVERSQSRKDGQRWRQLVSGTLRGQVGERRCLP